MKIENLQVAQGYTKTKNSNSTEKQEDFSKMLSGIITAERNSAVESENRSQEPVDSNIEEEVEVEVEENNIELINPLLQFLNMTMYEDKIIDISLLGESKIEDLSMEAINFIDTDIISDEKMNTEIPIMDFNFEDNIIKPELLVEEGIWLLEDSLQEDSTSIDTEINSRLTGDMPKLEQKDRIFSLDEDYIPVNEVKAPKAEELILKDTNSIVNPLDDEIIDIENEDSLGFSKWLNSNLEGAKEPNLASKINPQPKLISNENIQNVQDSIIRLMETTTEGNTNIMKVQLYPEKLGAINITIKMENGRLIAKILVEDDYVKQLFAGKIEQLSNNLLKQNVNMEQILVELNGNSNPNGNSQQKGGNFSNQDKAFDFDSELIEQNTKEEVKSDLGVLSILA